MILSSWKAALTSAPVMEGPTSWTERERSFVSWLLCLRSPALFGVWNGNAERMLRLLRAYPESMKRGPMGIRYLDMLEALARVQAQGRLPDFIEVDIMAYVATRPKGWIPRLP